MKNLDREIVASYSIDSDAQCGIWAELSGLTIPIDKLFGKFVLNGVVVLMGKDVLEALENSGRQTSSFEHFINGYLTPPEGIGKIS